MQNDILPAPHNSVIGLKTETERGASAYLHGYHGGINSLFNRVSHQLSSRIALKTYPMNLARPMISFTFDDIAQSAALTGAAILEQHDIRGTYYVASDLIGRNISGSLKATREEIKALSLKGHEIGLHTHSHLPVFSYSKFGLKADLKDNADILAEFAELPKNLNFCYPYGVTSLQAKLSLRKLTRSARCLWKDINHGRLDPYFLRSSMLDSSECSPSKIESQIQQASVKKGWLIFIAHSVGEDNAPFSTPLSNINLAINLAKQNNFDIVTINQGLDRLQVA